MHWEIPEDMYREGTLADCRAVYDLICELEGRQLPFERFAEIFRAQLYDGRYYCLVCEKDQEVIGVLNLRYEEQLHHAARIAEILEFAVKAAYRNKGIGKDMLAHACVLAKEAGCTQLEAACNRCRTNAHRFYERTGMRNSHFKFSESLTHKRSPIA